MKKILGTIVIILTAFTLFLAKPIETKAMTFEEAYNAVPVNVINTLEEEGWNIGVIKNLAQYEGYSYRIVAVTSFKRHEILFDDRGAKMDYSAFIHEVGHVIDYEFTFPSQLPEFGLIKNAECAIMVKKYPTHKNNYTTTQEYFAEAYQNCILHSDWMIENCPQTYAFIMNYSNALTPVSF